MVSAASMPVSETSTSSSCSPFEKSIIERTMQFLRIGPNVLMIIFLVEEKEVYKLKHVINWLNLFADYHNKEIIS